MKNKIYIGLATTFHDPAIAIVDDAGKVLFAEATERFLQYKRAPLCEPAPFLYFSELLKEFVSPEHQIVVATSWGGDFIEKLQRGSEEGFFSFNKIRNLEKKYTRSFVDIKAERAFLGQLQAAQSIAGLSILVEVDRVFGHSNLEMRRFDHHDSHAAYACQTSPFDRAACLVVDGMGGTAASAIYKYADGDFNLVKRFKGRESLGFFFGLITELCDWDPAKGEEWKVMGLAPYGKDNPQIASLLEKLWSHEKGRLKAASEENILSIVQEIRSLGDPADETFQASLAREGQKAFERLITIMLDETALLVNCENLIITGGCALNSSFNGKIRNVSDTFKNLYVPSAPADDGNAIGAAFLALEQDRQTSGETSKHAISFQTPYLGKDLSGVSLDRIADREPRLIKPKGGVIQRTAECLAEGKLIGWVQGRAEFGPRALGNRSILADPRPADAKDKVNAKVKYREAFRPFAPSILHDYGEEWFEDYQESPYMERTLKFAQDKRDLVPAVVHADGTGRLQTVKREWNQRYYDLISAFNEITGVPLLLNSSFNIMGKPILHTAEDALLMFYTTGIDVVVIGDYMIEK